MLKGCNVSVNGMLLGSFKRVKKDIGVNYGKEDSGGKLAVLLFISCETGNRHTKPH